MAGWSLAGAGTVKASRPCPDKSVRNRRSQDAVHRRKSAGVEACLRSGGNPPWTHERSRSIDPGAVLRDAGDPVVLRDAPLRDDLAVLQAPRQARAGGALARRV